MKNPIREKRTVHQFLYRAGYNDLHHLTSSKNGGQSLGSNLLLLDYYRHDAIHFLFQYKTLKEIIAFLKDLEEFTFKVGTIHYNAWRLLFKDKTLQEVIDLLKRLQRIKISQQERYDKTR